MSSCEGRGNVSRALLREEAEVAYGLICQHPVDLLVALHRHEDRLGRGDAARAGEAVVQSDLSLLELLALSPVCARLVVSACAINHDLSLQEDSYQRSSSKREVWWSRAYGSLRYVLGEKGVAIDWGRLVVVFY